MEAFRELAKRRSFALLLAGIAAVFASAFFAPLPSGKLYSVSLLAAGLLLASVALAWLLIRASRSAKIAASAVALFAALLSFPVSSAIAHGSIFLYLQRHQTDLERAARVVEAEDSLFFRPTGNCPSSITQEKCAALREVAENAGIYMIIGSQKSVYFGTSGFLDNRSGLQYCNATASECSTRELDWLGGKWYRR